jgi:hypothetical protein
MFTVLWDEWCPLYPDDGNDEGACQRDNFLNAIRRGWRVCDLDAYPDAYPVLTRFNSFLPHGKLHLIANKRSIECKLYVNNITVILNNNSAVAMNIDKSERILEFGWHDELELCGLFVQSQMYKFEVFICVLIFKYVFRQMRNSTILFELKHIRAHFGCNNVWHFGNIEIVGY